jgi:putative alpha-1,2-mannosidase
MADIAKAIGKEEDARAYIHKAENLKKVFNEKLFDDKKGVSHRLEAADIGAESTNNETVSSG